MENLNDEVKRVFVKEGFFTEEKYPLVIKPNFCTLESFIEITPHSYGSQINFVHDDRIRDLFGIDSETISEKYSL